MHIQIIPHLLLSIAPETPKFLFINNDDREGSKTALLNLRNNDSALVDSELQALEDEKYRLSQQAIVKWKDFWFDLKSTV